MTAAEDSLACELANHPEATALMKDIQAATMRYANYYRRHGGIGFTLRIAIDSDDIYGDFDWNIWIVDRRN